MIATDSAGAWAATADVPWLHLDATSVAGKSMTLAVSPGNAVTVGAFNPYHLHLVINPKTGTFAGTLTPYVPAYPNVEPISGVIDRKANLGEGLFIGPLETGAVSIVPQ